MQSEKINPAFVFGMFETGLGVGRSLGRNGVNVYGFDYKRDIGAYSKYVNFQLCPNPLDDQIKFIDYVINFSGSFLNKPVLYVTADEYLEVFSRYRIDLSKYLLMNIPDAESLKLAFNKNQLYYTFIGTEIDCPSTFKNISECSFPLIIKANDVNKWRNTISSNDKVIFINDCEELSINCERLDKLNIEYVLQEIIPGKDNCFYKYNTYRNKDGEIMAEFMLQKLRQNPIRFGVGSLVKSVNIEELRILGRKVFGHLNYKGVGSVEFKFDERDNRYKLIEINSRYWQQNLLPSKCGINFPLIEYSYLTNLPMKIHSNYRAGIKWINIYMDFSSFLKYRKEGETSFMDWIDDLKGEKVFSDFASDDILPGLYEIFLSNKLKRIPKYFEKNL